MISFVLIFPVNVINALSNKDVPGALNHIPYYLWIRLLFQSVYICWTVWSSELRKSGGITLEK